MPPVYGTSQDDDLDKSTASSGQMINTLQGDDTVIGSEFDDRIYLGSGDDSAQGGGGNDVVVGGDGTDTTIYRGSIFDFTWSEIRTDILQVTDNNASDGDDGTDTLRGIEQLQFDEFLFVIGGANAAYATVSNQVTDEDTAHSFMVQAWDFDGGDVSIHSITGASGGSFSVDGFTSLSSGMGVGKEFSISFDPGADYHHLGANDRLIEDIEVVISDGQGNFTTKTFQMTIDGVNDDPTAAGVTYNQSSVQEDGDLVATGTASFNDVDQGDVLSYSVQGGGAGTYGSLSINANGEWTYSLNNGSAAVQALNAGPSVQDTFTVVADDGNGGLATQDVSINVDGANEPFSMAGARLNYQYYYPDLSSPYGSASNGTYTVGPGVEVSNMAGGNLAYMDMREDNFLYISFNTGYGGSSYFYDRDFNGFVVTDIYDDMPDVVGVDIRPNRMGLDEADVAIANDSVSVNWAGKNFDPYTVIEIELLFA